MYPSLKIYSNINLLCLYFLCVHIHFNVDLACCFNEDEMLFILSVLWYWVNDPGRLWCYAVIEAERQTMDIWEEIWDNDIRGDCLYKF